MTPNDIIPPINWEEWMRRNHVKIDQVLSAYHQAANEMASLKEKAEKCEKHSS